MRSAEAERDLGHLKRLLLVEEQRQIQTLRQAVSALDERVGSDDRFCQAVADSLVVALKVAEVKHHRELAGVMAPIVVAGIRREIDGSKDLMVEAMYPIVGRLVTTAVAQALRQLAEDVNRAIESVLSPRSLRLRLKALVTRRPLAELVLAEASQDRIETLLLLDRTSGAVLASSAVREGRIEAQAQATDSLNLLGGLMAAIIEFANHALSEANGELRTLDFGGRTVLLRASPLRVVAAIGRGSTTGGLGARVDEAFLLFLEQQPDDAAAALAAMHGRFLALRAPEKPWNRRISALTLIAPLAAALAVCGLALGWFALRDRNEDAARLAQLQQAPELAGYPLHLAIDRARGVVAATALAPDPAAWAALRARIAEAFPDLRVEERVAVLSESPEARRVEAGLRQGALYAAALGKRLDGLDARLDGLAPSLDGLEAGQKQGEAASREALAALAQRLDRVERETETALAERAQRADLAEREQRTEVERASAATAALRGRLDGLDARLDGLAPSLDGLEAGQKRGEAALAERIDRLAARLDGLAPALKDVEAGQARAKVAAQDGLAGLAGRLDRIERETGAALADRPLRAEVARGGEATSARLDDLSARFDTPRRRLLDTVERTAIFFKDDAVYRDSARAATALEKVAEVLRAEPAARLRILGFADSLGTAKANLRVGRLRAEKVAADLAGLGIEPARLRVVGISQAVPVSDDVGAASANRRVTFEPIFADE